MSRFRLFAAFAGIGVLVLMTAVWAADSPPRAASEASDAKLYQQTVEKGIGYLVHKGQQPDGSYGKDVGPGVAAICTTALLKHGRSPDDPAVAKSLKYLQSV